MIGIGLGIPLTRNLSVISWTYVTSGLDYYRKGRRSGYYVIDYSADGGATWELDLVSLVPSEDLLIINIDGGVTGYRQQVRNKSLMIDHVLTETGFEGTEGTDWENVDSYASWNGYWSQNLSALFDTRSGLTITDSIGAEELTVKSFPVANYKTTAGANFYTQAETGEAPITTSGDWSFITVCKNENSDTVSSLMEFLQLNGNNKGGGIYLRSGALYNGAAVTVCSADLNNNTNRAVQIVGPDDPAVFAIRYNAATNVATVCLNGIQIDSLSAATTWALGLASGLMSWRGYRNLTDGRILGVWIFDRLVTDAEVLAIATSGTFPAIVPSRQYLHLNYGDIISRSVLGSHNRKKAVFNTDGSTLIWPDDATLWGTRYDNAVFAYPLIYGYTGYGNYKIPYSPTGVKMMTDDVGDIEFPATSVIHNMAESLIDFSGVTDADIKAIFDKSNRTYWKASIESELHYTDAGSGYYGLWHPSQLTRDFVTTHAEAGHENHIFTGIRTSGQCITGITQIAVCKTNII